NNEAERLVRAFVLADGRREVLDGAVVEEREERGDVAAVAGRREDTELRSIEAARHGEKDVERLHEAAKRADVLGVELRDEPQRVLVPALGDGDAALLGPADVSRPGIVERRQQALFQIVARRRQRRDLPGAPIAEGVRALFVEADVFVERRRD